MLSTTIRRAGQIAASPSWEDSEDLPSMECQEEAWTREVDALGRRSAEDQWYLRDIEGVHRHSGIGGDSGTTPPSTKYRGKPL